MGPTPYQYLPLPARCAIEYLDAQGYGNRTLEKLEKYLEHYFKTYGQQCDPQTRYSAYHIAIKRFVLDESIPQNVIDAAPSFTR